MHRFFAGCRGFPIYKSGEGEELGFRLGTLDCYPVVEVEMHHMIAPGARVAGGVVRKRDCSETPITYGLIGVEGLAHQILAECLDRQAPCGEVSCCSLPEGTEPVEAALRQLGLLQSAE